MIISSSGAAQLKAEAVHAPFRSGRAAMLDTQWQELYKAALFELNPNKLITRIDAARQAIVEQQLRADITQVEHRKLADARSMLATLSRLASSDRDRAA